MSIHSNYRKQYGFSVLEVVIGIFIFVVGMLALAALQGALSRSMADAKLRTTAVNLADRAIERQRGFTQLLTAATPGAPFAYNDIVTPDIDPTITREGVIYTIDINVTDYYYQLADDTSANNWHAFTTTKPTGVTSSDYKQVDVTVTWDTVQDLRTGEGGEIDSGAMNTGSVTLTSTIPAIVTSASGRVSTATDRAGVTHDVTYQPGDNPDVIKLSLGDSKFKESLTPEPKTYKDHHETRFDVVTYSAGNGDALFLRREEFVAVSCECTLRAKADVKGLTPTIWAGDEYTEPEWVVKAYGEVIEKTAQSPLCDRCCRDHHDSDGAGPNAFDPWRPTGDSGEYGDDGDHLHYSKGNKGLTVAAPGDDYVEACRFVRKDGFFRVAQDFRLEGLNTFAEDFLITEDQVNSYSQYVTDEVYIKDDIDTFVPGAIALEEADVVYQQDASPPTVDSAPRTAYGEAAVMGDLTLGYTTLPTSTNANFQQLRSRSIYVDNLSSDLMTVITCIEDASTDAEKEACESGDVKLDKTGNTNVLELIPFFEVQTTYLNNWKKQNIDQVEYSLSSYPVTTSDASGPTHSRGLATKLLDSGHDMSQTTANRGVTGLTSTEKINNLDYELPAGAVWPPGDIDVIISDTVSNVPGRIITGTLRSDVGNVKAADVSIIGTNSICHHDYSNGVFTCFIPTSVTGTPEMTLSGFDSPPKTIFLCSSHQYIGVPAELPVRNPHVSADPKVIDLTSSKEKLAADAPYELWLTEIACEAEG